MAEKTKGPDLGQQLEQLIRDAYQRQEDLAEQINDIRSELERMLGLALPIKVGDDLKEEIEKLTALVGTKPDAKSTKPKEDYKGKNISIDQKVLFVQEVLQKGPLCKKEMLDRAEIKFERDVAPTFIDTAIQQCEEEGLIEDTGEKKGRSIVYAAR